MARVRAVVAYAFVGRMAATLHTSIPHLVGQVGTIRATKSDEDPERIVRVARNPK